MSTEAGSSRVVLGLSDKDEEREKSGDEKSTEYAEPPEECAELSPLQANAPRTVPASDSHPRLEVVASRPLLSYSVISASPVKAGESSSLAPTLSVASTGNGSGPAREAVTVTSPSIWVPLLAATAPASLLRAGSPTVTHTMSTDDKGKEKEGANAVVLPAVLPNRPVTQGKSKGAKLTPIEKPPPLTIETAAQVNHHPPASTYTILIPRCDIYRMVTLIQTWIWRCQMTEMLQVAS
jgi:hypothetical protein